MLKIKNLNKSYKNRKVLQNLTFTIQPGEVYGLLGANGAGKTTTINIICNLLKADSGHVTVNHQPISRSTKKLIGIAPQENILYKTLSCAENLRFFAEIYGLDSKTKQKQVMTTLKSVNLLDRADSPVETLSGGMQRRLNIAVALVHQPQLLILDEPTTGLDIEARYEIWELIRNLKNQGMTILLTTHLLDEAERLCSRIGVLKNGQILAEGSLAELKNWVPGKEIVLVQTKEESTAISVGREHGFIVRRYGSDLAFLLPEPIELKELLTKFDGIEIDSISRQSLRLEHIYVEITQADLSL
ncbi:ABC transporter ATP-binding protein [Raphidiopsis curvata NIES-932]|nr:ABC transporter ATP-binding protein [Raphidiopsis curvata NIES-932]